MDFKNMTDTELAEFMVALIKRVKLLKTQIAEYLEYINTTNEMAVTIKNSYKQLKSELQEYGHYVSLRKNKTGSDLYEGTFVPSIYGAYAHGFGCPKNSNISLKLFSEVEESLYRLTKICSLTEWEDLL